MWFIKCDPLFLQKSLRNDDAKTGNWKNTDRSLPILDENLAVSIAVFDNLFFCDHVCRSLCVPILRTF